MSLALGSMGRIETVRTGRIFALTARALERAGRRGILLGGSDDALPENTVKIAAEVPYVSGREPFLSMMPVA